MDSELEKQILHELEGIRIDLRVLPVLEHRISDVEEDVTHAHDKIRNLDQDGTRAMTSYVDKRIQVEKSRAEAARARIWVAIIGGFAIVAAALITAIWG